MTTYSAVATTGIYCRPGCGARPLARNVRLFDHPAAAEAAGFRACHRCRPYRVAGPVGSSAPELVCEAVQRVIMGALDDGGTEAALARQVGVSARHLRRLFLQHLGATPDQLARSRRAHFARRLLDDTDLTVLDIAFASGFGSLRQFNRTMREVFGASPTDLRDRRRRADRLAADGGLALRLPAAARLRLGRHVRRSSPRGGYRAWKRSRQHLPADDHRSGRAWPAGSAHPATRLPAAPRALALLGRPDPRGGMRQPAARHRARRVRRGGRAERRPRSWAPWSPSVPASPYRAHGTRSS